MSRVLNRGSSLCIKVIYQFKMRLLTDKPIKGRQILQFMGLEESHITSVLLNLFYLSLLLILFPLYHPPVSAAG